MILVNLYITFTARTFCGFKLHVPTQVDPRLKQTARVISKKKLYSVCYKKVVTKIHKL